MNTLHGSAVPSRSLLRFLRYQLDTQAPLPSLHTASSPITPRILRRRPCNSLSKPLHLRSHTSGPSPYADYDKTHARSYTVSASRHAEPFWRKLRQARSNPKQLRPEDLPPIQGFLEDNAGLGARIIKPNNSLKLRCTEFDESGNVVLVNGEFRKSELTAKYSLLPRDLRKIDSSVLPHIVVRPSAILINMLHLRCLIKHNRVIVFDVYGSTDTYAQSLFMYDLEGKLRQKQNSSAAGGLPYEFRALEAVLISVTSGLEGEFEGVREPVVRVLRELEEDIDRDKLRYLLIYSKKLGTFEQKARLVRDAIEDLLEADDDLASMYLTEKAEGIDREDENHEEVELLLESYHKVADEIVQISSNLVSAIRNTEEIVRAILDANRNSLMLLDLKFSIGTLGISAGMFIAALYGMNLENFIEESNYGFFGITSSCCALTLVACYYGLRKLRKVQRLSMWGEGGLARGMKDRSSRGSWRQIDSVAEHGENEKVSFDEGPAGIRRAERLKLWRQAQNAQHAKLRAMQEDSARRPPAVPPIPPVPSPTPVPRH